MELTKQQIKSIRAAGEVIFTNGSDIMRIDFFFGSRKFAIWFNGQLMHSAKTVKSINGRATNLIDKHDLSLETKTVNNSL